MDFSQEGNNANSVNGNAKAMAKPNIPMAGAIILPVVETCTSKKPIMGPVQENDTSDSVNAIKKILSKPPVFSALESTALLHLEGRVISKAPKKEAANTTSIKKKKILKTAFVDNEFKALAPKSPVTNSPKPTYITTMDAPYVQASRIPFFLSLLRFRKKLTVIGIIGHTQGVNNANRPPTNPVIKI